MREMGSVVPEYRGVTYDWIDKVGLQTPVLDREHPGTPYLFTDTFPSGRAKFFPLQYTPIVEQPDDEYPFILTTGRLLEHWHGGTMTRNSRLEELYPEARVDVHPIDAARSGLDNGNAVKVSSRRGEVIMRTRVTEKTTPGVVFIPIHFAEAAANILTIDALDPQAKIPEFKACAIRMERVADELLPNPNVRLERGRW